MQKQKIMRYSKLNFSFFIDNIENQLKKSSETGR